MDKRSREHSLLFLTTLGVYLGLILVGSTPQVLAQAATTRIFDVRDEIEAKDDLDNKPNRPAPAGSVARASDADDHITRSVQNFLAKFKPAFKFDSIAADVSNPVPDLLRTPTDRPSGDHRLDLGGPRLSRIISVSNFPRGSLDALPAPNAR